MPKENDKKRLEQLKSGFKRTVKWNKCRSQTTVQSSNNNLDYLIDPTFTKVNRLFVLPFEIIAGENNTTKDYRDSFSHYYISNVEIMTTQLEIYWILLNLNKTNQIKKPTTNSFYW